jgi:AAA15 family ATPase/GTPase
MPSAQSFLAGMFTYPPSKQYPLTHHRDESFNSITGLNGSGKSNILDSICFVLGINNLSVVRAQNLQVGGGSMTAV